MKKFIVSENVLQAVKQYILNSSPAGLSSGQVIDLWVALQGVEEVGQKETEEAKK